MIKNDFLKHVFTEMKFCFSIAPAVSIIKSPFFINEVLNLTAEKRFSTVGRSGGVKGKQFLCTASASLAKAFVHLATKSRRRRKQPIERETF